MASTFVFSQDLLAKIIPFHFVVGTIYTRYDSELNNNLFASGVLYNSNFDNRPVDLDF